jgi:hypothetical protein
MARADLKKWKTPLTGTCISPDLSILSDRLQNVLSYLPRLIVAHSLSLQLFSSHTRYTHVIMNKIQRKPLPAEKPLPEDVKKDDMDSDLERSSTDVQEPPPAHSEPVKDLEGDLSPHRHSPPVTTSAKTTRPTFGEKFNRRFPAHRRYLGMSRKMFLCVLGGVILLLLALIIGLSVGLAKGKSR